MPKLFSAKLILLPSLTMAVLLILSVNFCCHRMSVVEPVFGNIGTNKKLKRFSLCSGKDKVQGQWHLFCLIHNLEKLNNYGQLAA